MINLSTLSSFELLLVYLVSCVLVADNVILLWIRNKHSDCNDLYYLFHMKYGLTVVLCGKIVAAISLLVLVLLFKGTNIRAGWIFGFSLIDALLLTRLLRNCCRNKKAEKEGQFRRIDTAAKNGRK